MHLFHIKGSRFLKKALHLRHNQLGFRYLYMNE